EAVVLVDDDVAGAEVGEGAQRAPSAAGRLRALGGPAAEEGVLGGDREVRAGGDEPVTEVGLGEAELRLDGAVAVDPRRAHAREGVGGALAVAPAGRPAARP